MYSIAADGTALKANVYGHASGNSPAFSASSLPAPRAVTTALTRTRSPAAWAANTWYEIDVSPVVPRDRQPIGLDQWQCTVLASEGCVWKPRQPP